MLGCFRRARIGGKGGFARRCFARLHASRGFCSAGLHTALAIWHLSGIPVVDEPELSRCLAERSCLYLVYSVKASVCDLQNMGT